MNRFSFDIRSVLDDDRRRLLKKYRETKKKAKVLFRRQADQGKIIFSFSFQNNLYFSFRNFNTFGYIQFIE
jgi:hypothetical protein